METELERRARIQRETAVIQSAVREGRLPPEAMQRYIERERVTPEMEAAKEPLGIEGTIKGAIANAGEGVGFSLADELMGGLRGAVDPRITMGEGIDEVRSERDRFAQAHPKTALGLTLGGAVLPAVLTAGLATGAGAPTMARVATSGAAAGAVAGYGSGEGGPVSGSRVGRGALGAGLGYAAGRVLPHVLQTQTGLAGTGGQVTDDLLSRLAPKAAANVAGSRAPAVAVQPANVPTSPQGFGDPAFRAAGRAIPDTKKARTVLDEIERAGMGDEALAMNVGDDQTVRAVRAAANQPGSTAGQTVNSRLAEQGGRLGESVHSDLGIATGMGGVPGPVRLDQMQQELSGKVKGAYDAFANRGDLATLTADDVAELRTMLPRGVPRGTKDILYEVSRAMKGSGVGWREALEGVVEDDAARDMAFTDAAVDRVTALLSPLRGSGGFRLEGAVADEFAPYLAAVRKNPALAELPPTDARVVGEAFHLLQEQVRRSGRSENAVAARGVRELRDRVLAAIGDVDPDFARVTRDYALDETAGKVVQDAFETGMGLPGKPVGQATVELGKTTPAGQDAMLAGHVTAMQHKAGERASNADLGDLAQFRDVARAAVGTRANRQQFIELHGQEKYDALLARLLPKIKAAAQNAAARGNSTTTKQLLDALAFGDDAAMDALGQLMTGSPQGALRTLAGKAWSPMDRAYRLGVGKTAGETADLLTTKGAPQIRSLLDYLEQSGAESVARKKAVQPISSAVSRTAVGAPRDR